MQKNYFSEFLTGLTSEFIPVVDAGFSVSDYIHIDLSIKNPDLSEKELSSAEAFSEYLAAYLQKEEKNVAWGGIMNFVDFICAADSFPRKLRKT